MKTSAYHFLQKVSPSGKIFLRLKNEATGEPKGVTIKLPPESDADDFNASLRGKSEQGWSVWAMVSESAGGDSPLTTRLLWADLDWKDYPGGKDQVDGLIAGITPAPSLQVSSGHGTHLYWYLDRSITPSTARELARTLAWRLGTGPTFSPNQKMRVPGTVNCKHLSAKGQEAGYTEAVPCEVTGGNGQSYTPNDFPTDPALMKLPHKVMTRLVRGPQNPATEDKSAYDYTLALSLMEHGTAPSDVERLLSSYHGSGKAAHEGHNKKNYVTRTVQAALTTFNRKGQPQFHAKEVAPVVWTRKTYQELLEAPRPAFLIEDFLPHKGMALIAAPPKARKSWAAMQLAHSMATGRSWLGFNVPAPKKVLYVQAELPDDVVASRFEQMYGREAVDNLQFIRVPAADLTQGQHLQGLLDEVQSFGAELVIIDPIANFWQGDENSASSVNALFDNLAQLQEAGCGVVLVHHSRKTQGMERITPQHMRGSSVFFARPDAVMTISPTHDGYSWADFTLRAAAPRDAMRLFVATTGEFTLEGQTNFQKLPQQVQQVILRGVEKVRQNKEIYGKKAEEPQRQPVEPRVSELQILEFQPNGSRVVVPKHGPTERIDMGMPRLRENVSPRPSSSSRPTPLVIAGD